MPRPLPPAPVPTRRRRARPCRRAGRRTRRCPPRGWARCPSITISRIEFAGRVERRRHQATDHDDARREHQPERHALERRQERHDRRIVDQSPQEEPDGVDAAAQHVDEPEPPPNLQAGRHPHHRHLEQPTHRRAEADQERPATLAHDLQRDEVPRRVEPDPHEQRRREEPPEPRRRPEDGADRPETSVRLDVLRLVPDDRRAPREHDQARDGVDRHGPRRRPPPPGSRRTRGTRARTRRSSTRGAGRSRPSPRRPGARARSSRCSDPVATQNAAMIEATIVIAASPSHQVHRRRATRRRRSSRSGTRSGGRCACRRSAPRSGSR